METLNNNPITQEDLDTMSASVFNAKLIASSSLQCTICKHFLRPPIMFVSTNSIGNVCGNCNRYEKTAVRNTALETLMSCLIWPCGFSTNGCDIKLDYVNIMKHETICTFRNYCCPLKNLDNCKWKGSKLQLLKHILVHSAFYTPTTNNCFKFDLNIDETNAIEECNAMVVSPEVEKCKQQLIKVFNLSSEDNFLLLAQIDSDKLYYKIYYLGTCEDVNTYCYKIAQTNSEDRFNEFIHGCINIEDAFCENFFQPLDFTQLQFINLKLCRLLATENKISFTIQIMPKNDCTKIIDKALLPALDCPVCKILMRPPIHQCDIGHSICNDCKTKVTDCPVCRTQSFSRDIRNYALESIINQLSFPCINREIGCNVNLPLLAIKNHENACTYKLYKCDFCSFECRESTIIFHLKNVHPEKVFFQSCQILSNSFIVSNKSFYIVAFRRIFKVEVSQINGYFDWTINLLGTAANDTTYEFEIGGIIKQDITQKFVHANIKTLSMKYEKYYLNIQQCAES